MGIIGQIVEIPTESPIYKESAMSYVSKFEELNYKSKEKSYSLFDGFLVGDHLGIENFIFGQRKGINVGGKKQPLYVIGMDKADNRLFVGAGDNHPGLLTTVIAFNNQQIIPQNDANLSVLFSEIGTQIQIFCNELITPIDAQMFLFDKTYFIELETPISIIEIKNFTTIKYQNTIIAIIR